MPDFHCSGINVKDRCVCACVCLNYTESSYDLPTNTTPRFRFIKYYKRQPYDGGVGPICIRIFKNKNIYPMPANFT